MILTIMAVAGGAVFGLLVLHLAAGIVSRAWYTEKYRIKTEIILKLQQKVKAAKVMPTSTEVN